MYTTCIMFITVKEIAQKKNVMAPNLTGETNISQSFYGRRLIHILNQIRCECLHGIPEVGECGLFGVVVGAVVNVVVEDVSEVDVTSPVDFCDEVAIAETVGFVAVAGDV